MNYPHKELNGILRHMFRKDKNYYKNSLDIAYTGDSLGFVIDFLFDFDSGSYWLSATRPEMFLSFCFKKGFAYISGYEIKTSASSARASKWAFSGSNNNETWEERTVVSHNLTLYETYYVEWKKGPFKCYRIDMLNSQDDRYRQFDFMKIELFGVFYPENYRYCTKRYRNVFVKSCLFVVLLLIS